MKESTSVAIITIFLLLLGLGSIYFSIFHASFNFYKTELLINNNEIKETLNYKPNKDYHTLYRKFDIEETKITIPPNKIPNGIAVSNVECTEGKPYVKISSFDCYSFPLTPTQCFPYTEFNEYGCGFGYEKGFKKDKNYQIISTYTLNPKNLFKIKNKYYIKFVAYSKNQHKTLIKGKNLIINKNAITKTIYFPMDDVIIYIPYINNDIENYNIIKQEDFEFDTNYLQKLFIILLALFPAALLLISWYLHGREHSYADIPPELSAIPNEKRKAWEVAAYFHPPFSIIDKEFLSAVLLDFYRRKLIDLKLKEKEIYIKINQNPPKFINKIKYPDLDSTESELLSILKELKEKAPKGYVDGDYTNLKALNSFLTALWIQARLKNLQKQVEKTGKTYIESKSSIITTILHISFIIVAYIFHTIPLVILYLTTLFIFSFIYKKSALLICFKEFYYHEYQQWQAFRKFLSNSYSIKNMPHKAVVLWEQYLVYGCALGVSKQVLKELKRANIITFEDYNLYNASIHKTLIFFAIASGTRGSSRGFGGAATGGIGGGGGGGR